ncbi:MAG: helix-turn-helix transcriptional regulator [Proteobacteria bacterium]|nr:helix-turn-helix transcriptional regulator [Pseudomonadota bacterium]
MNLLQSIGRKIQSIREKRGITQETLEDRTGINAKYISAIECGQKNITVLTLEKIAKGLDAELFELLVLPEGLESQETVKKAIESLLHDADIKTLNICLDFLRKTSA